MTKICNDGVCANDAGDEDDEEEVECDGVDDDVDDDSDGIRSASVTEEVSVFDDAFAVLCSGLFSSAVRERQKCQRGSKRL
mmetsp:Transcript_12414/g.35318  ORF Transcript_12414/g.35318 Transcript_12414/m.35318 type:complete len:81 (-) Transcript_12414:15-257(-)